MQVVIFVSMACIVYGKTYAEQLRAHSLGCADPQFAAGCNSAVNWNANTSFCTGSRLEPACNLAQVWGFSATDLLYGVPPLPLGVNMSVEPAQTFILNGGPCRRATWADNVSQGFHENISMWLAPDQLSADCIESSAVTLSQWTALNLAGWREGDQFINGSICDLCLCTVLMTASPSLWWDSIDAWPHSGSIRTSNGAAPCSEQAAEAVGFAALQGAAIVLVVVLNTLLATTALFLAKFERHNTIAEQVCGNRVSLFEFKLSTLTAHPFSQERATAIGVFTGQFVNTFLVSAFSHVDKHPCLNIGFEVLLNCISQVALVVYARIDPIKAALASQPGPTEWVPLFSGPYPDFTEQWFAVVGAQTIVTVVVNILLPLFPLLNTIFTSYICKSHSHKEDNVTIQEIRTRKASAESAPERPIVKGDFGLAERYGVRISILLLLVFWKLRCMK